MQWHTLSECGQPRSTRYNLVLIERGATHFTHWFQPQTGTTACKHDNFLTLKSVLNNGVEEVTAIDAFSGTQLLQSEPDASSFPNGGMRSTFEVKPPTYTHTGTWVYYLGHYLTNVPTQGPTRYVSMRLQ